MPNLPFHDSKDLPLPPFHALFVTVTSNTRPWCRLIELLRLHISQSYYKVMHNSNTLLSSLGKFSGPSIKQA